jgi:hypothetical protein
MLPDGHKNYAVRDSRAVSIQTTFQQVENFSKINEVNKLVFIKLVKSLQADGVRVIFFLPPYHPVTYAKLRGDPKYKNIFKSQDFFIETAAKYHIEVAGSYNPNICGCEASDFYDFHHTYGSSTKKILKNILDTI